jgi:hypothetical protein
MHGFTENYIKVKTPYNPDYVNQIIKVSLGESGEDCYHIQSIENQSVNYL